MHARRADIPPRLARAEAACRAHGLTMTVQRQAILRAVVERDDHPTADQLYDELQRHLPGVSRTTVYRVLDALVRAGAILKVSHPGSSARFDAKTHQHHHLVCVACNRVFDIEDERLNALEIPTIRAQGFRVSEFHVHLRGVCRPCQLDRADRSGVGTKTAVADGKRSLTGRRTRLSRPGRKDIRKRR